MRIDILHGPNLNLLGEREVAIYGTVSLAAIDARLQAVGAELHVEIRTFQSNHEGALIDWLQDARSAADAFLLNAAGLTHTSVALRDAVAAIGPPVVEVHLSHPEAREPFRRTSLLADVVVARVQGFGALGYELALRGVVDLLRRRAMVQGRP